MEIVKNIAAILGAILSAASVLALISKRVRACLSNTIRKYGRTDESKATITEIKGLLEQHIEDDRVFKEQMIRNSDITMEFTKTQCKNIIKNIFYRYNDVKMLPLYEKKTLMNIEELYIQRLECNNFASLLLAEMSEWDIDYDGGFEEDRYCPTG